MTRVMDGVARAVTRPEQPIVAERPIALVQAVPQPKRRVGRPPLPTTTVRFDGIRRQAAVAPVTRRLSAPLPKTAPVAAQVMRPAPRPVTTPLPYVPEPRPAARPRARAPWQLPAAWRRPAIGMAGVVFTVAVSVIASRALATPKATTARADQASELTSAATPAATTTPVSTATPAAANLQTMLNVFAAANPGKFAIVVKDLKTGVTASIDPDRSMTSASLYKLFVAQRTYQRVDLGQTQLGSAAGGGTGRNIGSCLNVMIVVSDNGCGRSLGTLLGWGAQNHSLEIEGYTGTTLTTPQQTSAADVGRLFERLYQGTLLTKGSSDQFLALLKSQKVNNRLPQGLPAGTVFAHKTGDLDGYMHDAGIVYGPKTDYLVVVMSGSWSTPGSSPALFASLSKQLWNYFEN